MSRQSYAVLAAVSHCYPPPRGRLSTCYSPVRHYSIATAVRLACMKPAASVRSEPGSNSPINIGNRAETLFSVSSIPFLCKKESDVAPFTVPGFLNFGPKPSVHDLSNLCACTVFNFQRARGFIPLHATSGRDNKAASFRSAVGQTQGDFLRRGFRPEGGLSSATRKCILSPFGPLVNP